MKNQNLFLTKTFYIIIFFASSVFSWGEKEPVKPELTQEQKIKNVIEIFRHEASIDDDYDFPEEDKPLNEVTRKEEMQVDFKAEPLICVQKKIENKSDLEFEKKLPCFYVVKNSLIIAASFLNSIEPDKLLASKDLSNQVYKRWSKYMRYKGPLPGANSYQKLEYNLVKLSFYELGKVKNSLCKNKNEQTINFCFMEDTTFSENKNGDVCWMKKNITNKSESGAAIFFIFFEGDIISCVATKKSGHRALYTLVSPKEVNQKGHEYILDFIKRLES